MSEAQSIRAINRLFEDESVRSELTDVEANLVLGWGEAQLSQWAARGLPDETFDPLSYQFARLLGAVNSYIGKRKSLRPEAQRSRLHEVGTLARTCGYKISPAELDQFIGHQSALGNQEAISELLGLLKPGGEIDLPPAPAPAVVSEPVRAPVEVVTAAAVVEAAVDAAPDAMPEVADTVTRFGADAAPLEVAQAAETVTRFGADAAPLEVPQAAETVTRFGADVAPLEVAQAAETVTRFGADAAPLEVPQAAETVTRFGADAAPDEGIPESLPEALPATDAAAAETVNDSIIPPPPDTLPEERSTEDGQ